MTERVFSLDAARGFAIFAMIVAHTYIFISPAHILVAYAEGTLNHLAAPLFALIIGVTIAVTGPQVRENSAPELTVLVPRTRAAELSQYLTHLSRYRGRNDMLHALDRDHPVLYPGKLLHKLLHRHTSRFLNMP